MKSKSCQSAAVGAARDRVLIPQCGCAIRYREFERLISAFSRLPDEKVRRQFIALMELVAEDEPAPTEK